MEELFKQRKEKLNLFRAFRKRHQTIHKKEIPNGIYIKCPQCGETLLKETLIQHLYVCPHCQEPLKITAWERIQMMTDSNSFREFRDHFKITNPLHFPGYDKKLAGLQASTQLDEAVITGTAKIDKIPVVIAVMDSRFLMGSMGHTVGEKITRAVEYATRRKLPLIIFSASGGARMQEGMISLMQMAKTAQAIARHQDAGLLYISCLTNPTTGGVTASFASLGDIILAEPHALIGFAGPRVIEQTIKQKLPEGFQRAEFMLEQGFIDRIVERKDLRATLAMLLSMHQ